MIESDQTLLLSAVLVILTATAMAAEKTRWGQTVSAPLIILVGAMLLANAGLIPHSAPAYSATSALLVPMAIPMLLMRADLQRVLRETGPMLLAFTLAVALTVIGCFVAAALIDMGDSEAAIASALTASYIGGSLNFVATSEVVGLEDSMYVAALSADTLGAVVFLTLLMMLPSVPLARKWMPSRFMDAAGNSLGDTSSEADAVGEPFSILKAVNGIALALGICALSRVIVDWLGYGNLFILMITVITLMVANFAKPLLRHVAHEFELGTFMMFVFFAAIGAGADLAEVVGAALPATLFIMILVTVHLALLLPLGRLFKLDLAEAMVASNACILGPPTAVALAASRGWRELITPGMLVGILGYSIGTFIGVAIYNTLA